MSHVIPVRFPVVTSAKSVKSGFAKGGVNCTWIVSDEGGAGGLIVAHSRCMSINTKLPPPVNLPVVVVDAITLPAEPDVRETTIGDVETANTKLGPVGPVPPVRPVAPVGPLTPVNPVPPIPVKPVKPGIPVGPVSPVGVSARGPTGPCMPKSPVSPVGPVGPVLPGGPLGPPSEDTSATLPSCCDEEEGSPATIVPVASMSPRTVNDKITNRPVITVLSGRGYSMMRRLYGIPVTNKSIENPVVEDTLSLSVKGISVPEGSISQNTS